MSYCTSTQRRQWCSHLAGGPLSKHALASGRSRRNHAYRSSAVVLALLGLMVPSKLRCSHLVLASCGLAYLMESPRACHRAHCWSSPAAEAVLSQDVTHLPPLQEVHDVPVSEVLQRTILDRCFARAHCRDEDSFSLVSSMPARQRSGSTGWGSAWAAGLSRSMAERYHSTCCFVFCGVMALSCAEESTAEHSSGVHAQGIV